MNWILWLIVAWLGVSLSVAIVFGRVMRARDEREMPPPLDQPNDERWRDAS